MRKIICDEDCFNCKFDDCIMSDPYVGRKSLYENPQDYSREYYEAHKEKIRKQKREYYKAKKQKMNKQRREYYEKHREEEKANRKKYYQANKEKIKARQRKYYEENKEKIRALQKKWYKANKEKVRQYYEANKEKIAARRRKYNELNREKVKESWHNYYEANKERLKSYYHQYYQANKEKIKEHYIKYREKNKEKIKEQRCKRYAANKEKLNEYSRKYYQTKNEFPYSSADILLLEEFTADYDEIMVTLIGENYAESLIDMTLPSKIKDLYETKWMSKADTFADPSLKSYVFGLLGELNNVSNSFLASGSATPFLGSSRTKIRNLYVKLHPDQFAGTFPYDAFIDDWDDGEYY